MHNNRRKTTNDIFNYDCEIKLSRKQIKNLNSNIKLVFNKYLLLENRKIRYVEKIIARDIYIFVNPSRSCYVIQSDHFNERFKGPMIRISARPEDLELGLIYTINNNHIGYNLLEYKKKLINNELYIFEDIIGVRFSIVSEDIVNKILPSSLEYSIIMSGNYFDV